MTRGGFGHRADITLIPAPLDFEDPACRDRADLADAWDYVEKGATAGVRGQGNPLADPKIREAIAVCGGCPHLLPCGEHAIRHGETIGVWGALLPGQRKALREAMQP